MANSITGPVWRIDTAPFTYTGPVRIKNSNWNEAVTAGDQIVVQDNASRTIIDSKAQQANYAQNFGDLGWADGLKVTTLTSGVLLINIGKGK